MIWEMGKAKPSPVPIIKKMAMPVKGLGGRGIISILL
jgi:hypothetical protein